MVLPGSPPSDRSILPISTCLIYRKRTAVEREMNLRLPVNVAVAQAISAGPAIPGGVQVPVV